VCLDYLELVIARKNKDLNPKTNILEVLHILSLFALEAVLLNSNKNTILYPIDSKNGTGFVWKCDLSKV
jgi:hypothetical protein